MTDSGYFEKVEYGPQLSWSSLCVERSRKTILSNVDGCAKPGQLTAIMGHSGSGKTTLLKVLAARGTFSSGKIWLSSPDQPRLAPESLVDDQKEDPTIKVNEPRTKQQIAFVADREQLEQTFTCREAIQFSARLRLPKEQNHEEVVDCLIRALNLESCANTQTRFLSAGERRRLSLAIELVVGPKVAILDEPTSGLDSYYGMLMLECLRKVADSGATVILSIHHPSVWMFNKLDQVILMHRGRVMVEGLVKDIPTIFEKHGYPVPTTESPSDWMLTVSQGTDVTQLEEDGFFGGNERHEQIQKVNRRNQVFAPRETEPFVRPVSSLEELKILFERDWKHTLRDRDTMIPRLLISVVGSAVFAIVFAKVADNVIDSVTDFMSQAGALFFFFLVASVAAPSLMVDAIHERPLFEREFRTGHFRIWTYVFVKAVREILIFLLEGVIITSMSYSAIGFQGRYWYLTLTFVIFTWSFSSAAVTLVAMVSDPARATDYIGLVLFPQSLFCGFFVAVSELPQWLQWAPWAQPLTYAFRLALEEEFRFCATPSERDGYLLNCATGLGDIFEGTAAVSEDATYTVAQTGVYHGPSGIRDYTSLVSTSQDSHGSLAYDACLVEDHMDVLIHDVSASRCSISTAHILSATLTPDVTLLPNSRALSAVGSRLEYEVHDGSTWVHEQHLYWTYPQGAFVASAFDYDKISNSVCDTLENVCAKEYFHFDNHTHCVESMLTLPRDQVNVDGVHSLMGNTTGCRMVYNFLAMKNPEENCPHISWLSQKDPNGNYKCDDKAEDTLYYNFSEAELKMYARVAAGSGIEGPAQARAYVSESRDAVCQTNPKGDVLTFLSETTEFDQINIICYSYLQANDATSEFSAIYWSALFGVILALRVLSGFFLYRQAHKSE